MVTIYVVPPMELVATQDRIPQDVAAPDKLVAPVPVVRVQCAVGQVNVVLTTQLAVDPNVVGLRKFVVVTISVVLSHRGVALMGVVQGIELWLRFLRFNLSRLLGQGKEYTWVDGCHLIRTPVGHL